MNLPPGSCEWWRNCVIYQVYLLSFQDSTGDGVGDLGGLLARLPYIAELGVDALWITPFYPSPMKDHGYDVSDHCNIHPRLGDTALFDAVVRRAHSLGLKVILDMVWAHTSDMHPWFESSRSTPSGPHSDWYVWADALPDGTPPNNWISVFGGAAWRWDSGRGQYYMHHFLPSQPHLNLANEHVQEACLDILRFWLARGIDGIRIDACNYLFHDSSLQDNPLRSWPAGTRLTHPYSFQRHVCDRSLPQTKAFLGRIRALLDEHGAVAIGEVGLDDDEQHQLTSYSAPGRGLHLAYCLDAIWGPLSAARIREQLRNAVATDAGICWMAGNHDVPRVASRWCKDGGQTLNRTLLALLTSLPGACCIYQGEELGLPEAELPRSALRDPVADSMGPHTKGRDGCRTPMPWSATGAHGGFSNMLPWLPLSPDHRPLAVDAQQLDVNSTLHFYRAFLAWRRTQPVLRQGRTRILQSPANVIILMREHERETWLCLFNLGGTRIMFELPQGANVSWVDVPGLPGGNVDARDRVLLSAYSTTYLRMTSLKSP